MPTNIDFSKMTKAELNHYLSRYTASTEEYNNVLAALTKLEKKDEEQSSKNFTWSKIAGIAAIVAAILALIQIVVSVYPLIKTQQPEKSEMLQKAQDSQRPTKNKASTSSSNTDQGNSISSKKTSTYDTPSKKTK